VVPAEASWVPNSSIPDGHGVPVDDNSAWATKRDEWANHMWNNRGHMHVYVLMLFVFDPS
jgi:hypothetical protein